MPEFLRLLFDTGDFPPRWQCGQWSAALGWLHIGSDLAIFAVYLAIPVALVLFQRRHPDLPAPVPRLLYLFAAFILACGLTHLNEAIIFWYPFYRYAGAVKALTAAVSWLTLAFLFPLIPRALALRNPARVNAAVKAATARLREQLDTERLFRVAVEASPSGMIAVNGEGQIVMINSEAERLFGYAREELVGQPIELLVPHELRERHPALRRSYVAAPTSRRMGQGRELSAVRKDGSTFPVEVGLNPVELDGESVILCAVVDRTDVRREQDALRHKTAELERSNSELEQFAYVASHDLQEPLRMVVSFMTLLEKDYRDQLDEEAHRYIDFAVDGAHRMKQMVDELLRYSRIDSRGSPFQSFPVGNALQAATHNLALLIEESGAGIDSSTLPEVSGDQGQIEQVLQNLIANAIKFRGADPPRIRITCQRRGASWEFAVADNGIGFNSGQSQRIFQMFQRLHERSKYDGNGIGLAIAKRIIGRHGGEIWATSTVGVGSTFHFTLPCQQPADLVAQP